MAQTKINDLQAFLVIARGQSFTKAAAELGITPSALSHRVRTLEERLGYVCWHARPHRAYLHHHPLQALWFNLCLEL